MNLFNVVAAGSRPVLTTRALLALAASLSVMRCLATEPAPEAVPAGPVTAAPIATAIQAGEIRDREQVKRIYMSSGTNEVMMVAPRGMRIDASLPGTVVINPRDQTFYLSIRLSAQNTASPSAEPDAERVRRQHPGADNIQEDSVTVLGKAGKSFHFLCPCRGVKDRVGSMAFVQTSAGWVEFSLIADPQQAKNAADTLHALLLSLRTNEDGKIEVIPIPRDS